MKALFGSIRSLVLGDTWSVPLGVAAVVAVGAGLDQLVPDLWSDWGGIVLVVGAASVLAISTGPRPKRPDPGRVRPGGHRRARRRS